MFMPSPLVRRMKIWQQVTLEPFFVQLRIFTNAEALADKQRYFYKSMLFHAEVSLNVQEFPFKNIRECETFRVQEFHESENVFLPIVHSVDRGCV